ncbi:hypothetical protein ACP70R_029154 [Stipagrostis hirtigluma subsp. patula]
MADNREWMYSGWKRGRPPTEGDLVDHIWIILMIEITRVWKMSDVHIPALCWWEHARGQEL